MIEVCDVRCADARHVGDREALEAPQEGLTSRQRDERVNRQLRDHSGPRVIERLAR